MWPQCRPGSRCLTYRVAPSTPRQRCPCLCHLLPPDLSLQIDVTFGGVTVEEAGAMNLEEARQEKSFTLGMRVSSPDGEQPLCMWVLPAAGEA